MEDRPSLVILGTRRGPERRSRGRPKAEDSGVTLSTWVRATDYDRLCELANDRRQSVSSLVRSLLMLRLHSS